MNENDIAADVRADLQEATGEMTMVAGREIDADKAAMTLDVAVDLVKQKCGHLVDVDLNKVHFKILEGNIIGEAHETHVDIDPVLLLHPAARMASALAHELLHMNKAMSNEELVDAMSIHFFPDGFNTVYEGEKMIAFAKECNSDVETIYKMYYERDFDGIYAMHQLARAGTHPSREDSQAALERFRAIFPELTFVEEPGEWTVKSPTTEAADGPEEVIAHTGEEVDRITKH